MLPMLQYQPRHELWLGNFGQPFGIGGSHFLRKVIVAWLSIQTEHSPIKMTSWNWSFSSRHFLQNTSHFSFFVSLMSSQYFFPDAIQPNLYLNRRTLAKENEIWTCSLLIFLNSRAVNLFFFSISQSTNL